MVCLSWCSNFAVSGSWRCEIRVFGGSSVQISGDNILYIMYLFNCIHKPIIHKIIKCRFHSTMHCTCFCLYILLQWSKISPQLYLTHLDFSGYTLHHHLRNKVSRRQGFWITYYNIYSNFQLEFPINGTHFNRY